jgi:hypothetical protein
LRCLSARFGEELLDPADDAGYAYPDLVFSSDRKDTEVLFV